MDPRLMELLDQHQREKSVLFDQFRKANPTLQIDVDGAEWTAEQEADWNDLTRDLDAEHAVQREALAVIIDSEQ